MVSQKRYLGYKPKHFYLKQTDKTNKQNLQKCWGFFFTILIRSYENTKSFNNTQEKCEILQKDKRLLP